TQSEVVKQEVINRMCGRYRVQANDARVGLFDAISLGFTFFIRLRFFRELGWVDKLIAPQAATPRADWSFCAHYIHECSFGVTTNLRAKLHARNEILMDKRIKHQSRSH